MALHYTLHYITCKDITIHVGNSTIAQSEDGVTRAYFPEDVSPECSKVGSEFHFKTSGNEVIITPDVAPRMARPSPESLTMVRLCSSCLSAASR